MAPVPARDSGLVMVEVDGVRVLGTFRVNNDVVTVNWRGETRSMSLIGAGNVTGMAEALLREIAERY